MDKTVEKLLSQGNNPSQVAKILNKSVFDILETMVSILNKNECKTFAEYFSKKN